jgi:3-oxoacyl-[acyl-carrier protein] reductase
VTRGTVLISGAAGGIGLKTVERFLACDYEVLGVDLDDTVTSIDLPGFRGLVADVRDAEALESAVSEHADRAHLRHVVGLAGWTGKHEGKLLDLPPVEAMDVFRDSVDLNLSGQFALIAVALPYLERTAGDRSITLCSSVNALASYGVAAYSAAKAGLIGMMNALSTNLGSRGIRINTVAPGTTRTAHFERDARDVGDPGALERIAGTIPLQRVAEPIDVAEAIECLADRLTFVTGEVLRVDGGQLLAPVSGPALPPWRERLRRRVFGS